MNTATASFVTILGQLTEIALRTKQPCSLKLPLSEMNSFLFGHWGIKNVNFSLENLCNRVDFLTAKLMNSWKHIDMKQAIIVTQNSLQSWDIAIHLEESHKIYIFTKKKRSTAQFTCTTNRAVNPFRLINKFDHCYIQTSALQPCLFNRLPTRM